MIARRGEGGRENIRCVASLGKLKRGGTEKNGHVCC